MIVSLCFLGYLKLKFLNLKSGHYLFILIAVLLVTYFLLT